MGFYRGPNIVTDGLVYAIDAGSTRSYAGSGTTATSLVGSISNTLNNGVGFSTDNGGTWTFDGTDDKITVANSSTMQPTSALTMEAWVRLDTMPSSWYSVFQSPESNSGHTSPFFDWAIYVNYTGGLHTRINGISDGLSTGTTTKMQVNTWSQVVITWNGSLVSYYLSGVLIQTVSLSTTISYTNNTNKLIGTNASGSEAVDGKIPIVRFYNRAITAAEVLQNFNAQKSRFGL